MYFYLVLEVAGEEGRPALPCVRPVSEHELSENDYASVRWQARYVTREDTIEGSPAVLVFTDSDKATSYAGFMLAEEYDVAVISASDEKIQEHAFEGDPEGLCIVDPQTWHPPGLPVKVSKLAEWVETSELEE